MFEHRFDRKLYPNDFLSLVIGDRTKLLFWIYLSASWRPQDSSIVCWVSRYISLFQKPIRKVGEISEEVKAARMIFSSFKWPAAEFINSSKPFNF